MSDEGRGRKNTSNRGRGREGAKKYYKLIISKLPFTNYTSEKFQNDMKKLAQKLKIELNDNNINKENDLNNILRYEQFIEGKISRQNGQVTGTGFVSTTYDSVLRHLLNSNNSETQIQFLEGIVNLTYLSIRKMKTVYL